MNTVTEGIILCLCCMFL